MPAPLVNQAGACRGLRKQLNMAIFGACCADGALHDSVQPMPAGPIILQTPLSLPDESATVKNEHGGLLGARAHSRNICDITRCWKLYPFVPRPVVGVAVSGPPPVKYNPVLRDLPDLHVVTADTR